MAGKQGDLQFKPMLLALAAQIEALANARKAVLKLHPVRGHSAGREVRVRLYPVCQPLIGFRRPDQCGPRVGIFYLIRYGA
jgi:hypothetical protein